MRVVLSNMAPNTGSNSPADALITLRTSEVAENRSNASSRSRVCNASSISDVVAELRRRALFDAWRRFGVAALPARVLVDPPSLLERRRIAHPKAQDYTDF